MPPRTLLGALLVNLLIVLAEISAQSAKVDRYIMPLIPGLAIVAAAGWLALVGWLGEWWQGRGARGVAALPLALLLLLQVGTAVATSPYYILYFNPLLGGAGRAQQRLMIGNGELLERAATWIAAQGEPLPEVASWYDHVFTAYYAGRTSSVEWEADSEPFTWAWMTARYVVTYVNQHQRQLPLPEEIRYFEQQEPLHVVRANGVEYARIYPGVGFDRSELDTVGQRASLQFGDSARLLGFDLAGSGVAGGTLPLTLFWEALGPFPSGDFVPTLRLVDAGGAVYGESGGIAVGGFLPVEEWQSGQLIRDVRHVPLPAGTPPGRYTVELSFRSPSLGDELGIVNEGQSLGVHVALGTVEVARPDEPPLLEGTGLSIGTALTDTMTTVAGARLLGYEARTTATTFRAGDGFPLTLLWQVSEPRAAAQTRLFLELSDGATRWRRMAGHPLGGGSAAPDSWRAGEWLREVWDGFLPADAPLGHYHLRLLAENGGTTTVLLDLGSVDLVAREHVFALPVPAFPQQATFGDAIRLLGYDLPTPAERGQPLPLVLHWQAGGEIEQHLIRFVHLRDAVGNLVAQQDGPPGEGAFPTSSWIEGEIVSEVVPLVLPNALPTGAYHLVVGLYDPRSGARLATAEGATEIVLEPAIPLP